MPTNVHIENIENLHLHGFDELAIAEQLRGASTEGLGYGTVPDNDTLADLAAEQAEISSQAHLEVLAERLTAEHTDARARRNHLRNASRHADRSRKLEGFQTNHEREPKDPSRIDEVQHSETLMAHRSLVKACGVCALRDNCKLANNIDKWLDLHPFKDGKDGRRRPGSLLPPNATETRKNFLKALEQDPLAHCDPRVRKGQQKKAA